MKSDVFLKVQQIIEENKVSAAEACRIAGLKRGAYYRENKKRNSSRISDATKEKINKLNNYLDNNPAHSINEARKQLGIPKSIYSHVNTKTRANHVKKLIGQAGETSLRTVINNKPEKMAKSLSNESVRISVGAVSFEMPAFTLASIMKQMLK